jgi:hypothetical protein
MNERTTVRLSQKLLSDAKETAREENRTLTSLMEEGLQLVVARHRAGRPPRVLPPVSDASGPPFPGIDITNGSAMQELDDLEYIERLKTGFQ